MTMPTIDARRRHAHRVNGKFATHDTNAPIGRMPRTPDGLSDDAWREDIAMPAPPYPWGEPAERETWFSWRDWEWRDLWAVAFVGLVIAFGTHLAGIWGA